MAAPRRDAPGGDFFIVNRLGDTFTHLDLSAKLRVLASDGARSSSPDIVLRIGGAGRFSAAADGAFNRDKGRLVVTTDTQARSVRIRIERIAPRAVMKVNITVRGLPYVDPGLSRAAKTQLRYDHERYLDGCHAK
ncbi:MAG: hypothetical protein C0505_14220 [Leptothrix sp. (in: Bacteria)]|nr:hypothetical protein [Leptothrix sp. (in: b-proteobacteria)]